MIRIMKLNKDDIKTTLNGNNYVIETSDKTLIIFTKDAVRELIADINAIDSGINSEDWDIEPDNDDLSKP